jgi:protein-tyrosine phosphatase
MYLVPRSGPGRLSTMARPRGNDWLDDEINGLREAEVNVLVSMLTPAEVNELDLEGESDAAKRAGFEFISCPTPDRGVPATREFRFLLDQLGAALSRGQNIVVHCRAGIGRSSLVAAGLLISEGMSGRDAWEAVSAARGLQVPDTEEQRIWLLKVMAGG